MALQRALAIEHATGNVDGVAVVRHSLATAALVDRGYEEARLHLQEALHLWLGHHVAEQFLDNAFVTLAVIADSEGDTRRAAVLLASVDKLSASGRVLPPQQRERFDAVQARVRESLSPSEHDAVLQEVKRMSLEEAVKYAVASID